jgi:hypothetical protein
VFWIVALYQLINIYCLLKDHNAFFLASGLHGLFDRENEGANIFHILIVIYQSTWHNNSEDSKCYPYLKTCLPVFVINKTVVKNVVYGLETAV